MAPSPNIGLSSNHGHEALARHFREIGIGGTSLGGSSLSPRAAAQFATRAPGSEPSSGHCDVLSVATGLGCNFSECVECVSTMSSAGHNASAAHELRVDRLGLQAVIAPRSRGYSVCELRDLETPTGGGIAQEGRALSASSGLKAASSAGAAATSSFGRSPAGLNRPTSARTPILELR